MESTPFLRRPALVSPSVHGESRHFAHSVAVRALAGKRVAPPSTSQRLTMAHAGAATSRQHPFNDPWGADDSRQSASARGPRSETKQGQAAETSGRAQGGLLDPRDLPGALASLAEAVSCRIEEAGFEAAREVARLDARLALSEKIEEAKDRARQAADDVDCTFQIRQGLRRMQWEAAHHTKVALRQLDAFRRSPLFPFAVGCFLAWSLVTGWLARALLCSLCLVPLFPFVAQSLVKAALVEGDCPSCGHHFVGPRRLQLACAQCKQVVWRPRGKRGGGAAKGSEGAQRPALIVIDLPAA